VQQGIVTILAVDIVEASARHADDVRAQRLAVVRAATAAHEGREVRATDDGLLLVFGSAAGALRCALELRDAGSILQAGLDVGEPGGCGPDLHGPPVVVAQRLCETASAGEILATDVVSRIASRRVRIDAHPAGTLKLRDVEQRLTVMRIGVPHAPEPESRSEISVVIVDDEPLLRAGFRVILEMEPDITVVGEAGDGRAAIDVVRRRRPDVVLMDIRMPKLDGLAAARAILADPELRTDVLVLTTFDSDEHVYEALRIGASGFLLKDAPPDRLIDAIRVVSSGEALLAPAITRRLVEHYVAGASPTPVAATAATQALTTRELDVLRLIARGLSNAEIAAELVLTEHTIKTHVARVLAKLGLRDRVQVVVLAYETGLVTPRD
jgi:DNA-binding NarL/FixJ family response regulator